MAGGLDDVVEEPAGSYLSKVGVVESAQPDAVDVEVLLPKYSKTVQFLACHVADIRLEQSWRMLRPFSTNPSCHQKSCAQRSDP